MSATILFVEDDPDDVLLIERAFKRAELPLVPRVVSDGEAATAYLSGTGEYGDRLAHPAPSLVLLDLKLPRLSGLEVLAWIRRDPRVGRLPVVILTSSRESIDIERAYELGANSYLVKPVGFEALLRMVRTLNLYWLGLNQPPSHEEPARSGRRPRRRTPSGRS
jgi:CheY-like chemotaxis protein